MAFIGAVFSYVAKICNTTQSKKNRKLLSYLAKAGSDWSRRRDSLKLNISTNQMMSKLPPLISAAYGLGYGYDICCASISFPHERKTGGAPSFWKS